MQEGANIVSISDHLAGPTKAEMISSIQAFCLKRNFEDALSREEIARLEKFDRVDAQRKSLLVNLSRYYRDNPRADVAPGVLTIITLLSDNDKGACTMSQAQMGIILYRTRTSIAEAATRLRESETVRTVNGKAMSYPTIPRAVTRGYNHVVWVAEALKIVATCPVDPTGSDLSRRPDRSITPVPSKRQVSVATCRVEGGQPVPSTGHNFTKDNSTTLSRAASVVIAGVATAMSALPMAAEPIAPPVISQPATNQHNMRDVSAMLFEAAGNAMQRGRPALEIMSTPRNWLDNGCDLEMDILPTVRELALRKPPQSISTWQFFTSAIADAKARRTAPLPVGNGAVSEPKKTSNYSYSGNYMGKTL